MTENTANSHVEKTYSPFPATSLVRTTNGPIMDLRGIPIPEREGCGVGAYWSYEQPNLIQQSRSRNVGTSVSADQEADVEFCWATDSNQMIFH